METLAAEYLLSQGFFIVQRNFRCKFGEIDLIAKDKQVLCFVEVKYRKNTENGFPEEAVDIRKQKKIITIAKYYLMCNYGSLDVDCRFDVISICDGEVKLYRNAFMAG